MEKKKVLEIPDFVFGYPKGIYDVNIVNDNANTWFIKHLRNVVIELEEYVSTPLVLEIITKSPFRGIITGSGFKLFVRFTNTGITPSDRLLLNSFIFTGYLPYKYPASMSKIMATELCTESVYFKAAQNVDVLAKEVWEKIGPIYSTWLSDRAKEIELFHFQEEQSKKAQKYLESTTVLIPFESLDSIHKENTEDYNTASIKFSTGKTSTSLGGVKIHTVDDLKQEVMVSMNLEYLPIELAVNILDYLKTNGWAK